MLLSRFCSLILFVVLACPIAANAEHIIDDFASATANSGSSVVDNGSAPLLVTRVIGTGYEFDFLGNFTETRSLTYTFIGGLYRNFGSAPAHGPVKFEVPFWRSTDGNGTYTVNMFIIEGATETSIFSQALPTAASSQSAAYVIDSQRTIGDLMTTDIDKLRIDVTFTVIGATTSGVQTLHFGGTGNGAADGNLFAVPEPTSVMMFGSIIGGLLFRRRRN